MQQEDKACFVQGGRELAEAAYKTGFDDGFEAAVYSLNDHIGRTERARRRRPPL